MSARNAASRPSTSRTRRRLGSAICALRGQVGAELHSVVEKGVFHFLVSSMFIVGVQAVANVLLARILGPQDLGHVSVIRSVLILLTPLATFQAQLGITRAVARASDASQQGSALRSILPIPLTSGVVVAVGLVITMLLVRPLEDGIAMNYLVVVSLVLPCLAVTHSVQGVVAGMKQIKQLARIRAVTATAQAVGNVAAAVIAGLMGWAVAMVVIPISVAASLLFWKRRFLGFAIDSMLRREFVRFSSFSTASNTLSALTGVFGVICVDQFLGDPKQQGWLSIGIFLLNGTNPLVQSLIVTLFPYLSEQSRNPRYIWRNLWRVLLRVGAIFFAMGAGITLTAPWLVPWLMGQAYRPAVPIVQVVGGVVFARALLATSAGFINALGHSEVQLALTVTSGVVIIPMTIFFVVYCGVIGVPLAQLVTFATVFGLAQAWWIRRGRLWRRDGLLG